MKKVSLELNDPSFTEWQQAGVISLLLAVRSIRDKNPYNFHEVAGDRTIVVLWEGDDIEAWTWLFKSHVQIKEGIINTPFGGFFQHIGMLATLLQIPTTRPKSGANVRRFHENNFGAIEFNYLELKNIIHYGYSKKLFLKDELQTPSWLIPNCSANPEFIIDFKTAFSSWFAFPVCSFYQGTGETYLVIPMFKNLNVEVSEIRTPDLLNFKVANIYDAAINCLRNNPKAIGVKCFSYRHEKSTRANKINNVATILRQELDWELIAKVQKYFPNSLFQGDYVPFIKGNEIRGWLYKNICNGNPLWAGVDDINPKHLTENKLGLKKLFFPQQIEIEATQQDSEPIVDDRDRHLLDKFHWRKGKDCGWFRRYREKGKQKTLYLHREILGVSGNQGFQVFFKNGNKNDCRRENIQALTMSEFRTLKLTSE